MRAPCVALLLACCATPQAAPVGRAEPVAEVASPEVVAEPASAPDGDYDELVIAAIDAFFREEFESAEANARAALRLRPNDQLAKDLGYDSRRAVYAHYIHLADLKRKYRRIRDALGPPGPP